MAQENIRLLLIDLSARLPYGVMIHLEEPNEVEELYCLNIPQEGLYTRNREYHNVSSLCSIEEAKPYLRPMATMTDEERNEFLSFDCPMNHDPVGMIDWLLRNHFDFRCLIPKGLAVEAPKGMYDLNEE